ncbi:MAG: NAD(P)H-quinone oxidoreductase [Propionicimonas sp.]|uniref:NAD(P)H-quinone oxidoreductase n=1 Tax=Propionicimonas sp. TaxID=1955623 RepID=UPI001DA49947|nr:NAD(P)H-quinone oxidoreductase [Propionicimonas sp.]MBU4188925.1 NAD(P)H-quinone oxidoreductase [Actinomycetota bacterium]MBU4206224.1 NAD(P)H-quinone oxidoreductase [Actinomycetota bacterium]MBU4251281.1 NAD(P)H-quinone oxidoreductase [Actinomycetota bacterium]MBU4365120.1 NAD(P)H-quinone oxidoreductase [Actinomycetota bacterium]MBU4588183.1 NAD(P)H-quinone oxidoreductase [Actinomycetota bacterium]
MRIVTVTAPGGSENLAIAEAPTPSVAPGELLIEVMAAGVNRADVLQRQGFYPPPPGISDVIGLEVAGTVAGLGEGVSGWHLGDPCVALLAGGGYAEYVNVPAGQVIPPPPGVELVSAAGLIEVAATVVSNFDHVHLEAGETVLIHGGAGGIGTFAIQYAKALGARVIVTAGTAEKLQLCRSLGADVALDYHDDWAEAVTQATGGAGADVILDIMGAKYLEANVGCLATDGRLVVIGLQGGRKGTLDLNRLLIKRATVTATSLRGRPVAQKAAVCTRVAERVWPLIANSAIKLAPETRFAFAEVAAAHQLLESGESVGKIVLVW